VDNGSPARNGGRLRFQTWHLAALDISVNKLHRWTAKKSRLTTHDPDGWAEIADIKKPARGRLVSRGSVTRRMDRCR